MNISTVGLDLAKNLFQVHGIDDTGKVIVRRGLCHAVWKSGFGAVQAATTNKIRHEPRTRMARRPIPSGRWWSNPTQNARSLHLGVG